MILVDPTTPKTAAKTSKSLVKSGQNSPPLAASTIAHRDDHSKVEIRFTGSDSETAEASV